MVALMLKEKILSAAVRSLPQETPTYKLDIVNGNIVNAGPNGKKIISLDELATNTLYNVEHSEHLTAEATTQVKSNAFSFGCAFTEVEVDIPLCKINLLEMVNCHDCGRLINPKLAEAQVHGGMSMAIGYGMYEQMIYDPKTGKLLNGNLLDYKLPTIMDHPRLESEFIENPEPTSPYGTKALGEPPTVPGAAAIRNAVLHATGVAINTIPLSPHVLFAEFSKAGLV
jgi:xanthine dehydrogenase molybdenum-binding subunit